MGFDHYKHINSEWWNQLREVYFMLYGTECVVCGKEAPWNQLHHTSYKNVCTPYEILDCVSTCDRHHEGIHNTLKHLKIKIK